jgi:hypothetical protein
VARRTFVANKKHMKKQTVILLILAVMITVSASAGNKGNKSEAPTAKAAISGIITDKSSNETLTGVLVELDNSGLKAYTNAKGEFTFDGLTPGTYKVKVNCISYHQKEITIKVAKPETENVKVTLNPIEP